MQNSAFLNTKQVLGRCFLLSSVILAASTAPAYGVQLNFANVTGNLSNGDSDNIGATMTYESVADDNGIILDLIVTTLDSYDGDTSKNGNLNTSSESADGRINITVNTSTKFQFRLVNAADNSPYIADTLEFGLFDIDGQNNNAGTNPRQEQVVLYTPASYTVANPNNFESITVYQDRVEFLSQDELVTNPTDSRELSEAQEQHAVNFVFSDVSEFELGFEVFGGNTNRNFFFAGDIVLDDTATTIESFTAVPFEFSPGLGLLLSGGGLLGIKRLKRRKLQKLR